MQKVTYLRHQKSGSTDDDVIEGWSSNIFTKGKRPGITQLHVPRRLKLLIYHILLAGIFRYMDTKYYI